MSQTEVIPAAVEAVLAGDPLRFAEIVRAFDASVRRIVSRTLRDSHALEDVVQEVWLRVYRQLATLLDVRTTEAWIGRIARNCVIDHHRQRRRLPHFDALLDEVCEPAPGGWVWDLVDSMPEPQRQLLAWCYRDGHSYAEIGQRLAVPPSTVRGRLYEARLALRRLIEHRSTR